MISTLLLFGLTHRTLRFAGTRGVPIGGSERRVAFFIAALWAVHPLQTESVTCVIQRTELLFTLFYLATLYSFARGAEPGGFRGSPRIA